MVRNRTGGSKQTSCGIILIGQDSRLRERIAFVLRVAGFGIATPVVDADLAVLRAVASEHGPISIFEVNDCLEETCRHLKYLKAVCPTGQFNGGETSKNEDVTLKRRRHSARVGKGADGTSGKIATSRVVVADDAAPTDRQAMILKSLVNGDSNKVVARKLHIAEGTVKVHMKRLLRRIGVTNRTQAAIWALNHYFAPAANETADLRRARSARAAEQSELGGPPGPQLRRSRRRDVKGRRSKNNRRFGVAKYR